MENSKDTQTNGQRNSSTNGVNTRRELSSRAAKKIGNEARENQAFKEDLPRDRKKNITKKRNSSKTLRKDARKNSELKVVADSVKYLIIWSALMIIVTGANMFQVELAYDDSALRQARDVMGRDTSFRQFIESFGGVYAEIDEDNLMADFSHEALSTVNTSNGLTLTRLNPASFASFVNNFSVSHGVRSAFVSFDNDIFDTRPDTWESDALRKFSQQNINEVYEEITVNGERFFRYIVPLVVEELHLENESAARIFADYVLGSVYGGYSIYLPLGDLHSDKMQSLIGLFVAHTILWFLGCLILYAFTRSAIKYFRVANEAELRIEENKQNNNSKLEEAYKKINELQAQVQKSHELKSEFLASISHEVRTPLNGVIGLTELLLHTELDDSQASMIASLKASGNNLLNIINDVWDFAKIEAGQIELDIQRFPLRDTLFDVVKSLAPYAYAKHIEIIANISPQVPDIVLGDALRLRQILFNLVDNAIKFTESGEITLSVQPGEINENTMAINFSVKDTGIGISKERQKKIFQALDQEDMSTTRKYDGVGLGLTISSKFVQLMGSEIKIVSEVNKGSTFYFTLLLPFVEDSYAVTSTMNTESLKNIEVLIVDDNVTNRKILVEQTKGWGMNPTECVSVDEALRAIQLSSKTFNPISIVLTDLQMPEKDGIDLAQALKSDNLFKHVPIILLSSGTVPTKISPTLLFANLSKPIRPSELLRILLRAAEVIDSPDQETMKDLEVKDIANLTQVKMKILLVEDLEINQIVTCRMLETLGHIVLVANNGQQAIEILERESFDIVLMDIKMPVMDGIEALKIIRKREEKSALKQHLPIVALTANALAEERDYYLAQGMDSYLLKPVSIRELAQTIEHIVQQFEISDENSTFNASRNEKIQNVPPKAYKTSAAIVTAPQQQKEIPQISEKISAHALAKTPDKPSTSLASSVKPNTSSLMPSVPQNNFQSSVSTQTPAPSVQAASSLSPSISATASLSPSVPTAMSPSVNLAPSVTPTVAGSANYAPSNLVQPSTQVQTAPLVETPKEEKIIKERTVLPPLDPEAIKRSFSSFPDLAIKSMNIFLKDAPKLVADIQKALEMSDNQGLTVNAHAVKGLVSYYTKGEIYETALKLENMGRNEELPGNSEEVRKTLYLLEEQLEEISKAMDTYLLD